MCDRSIEHDTSWGGWQGIYDEYSKKLKAAGASITYVKEKYGFMRFEANYTDNVREIERLIHEAEEESLHTCQECGEKASQVEISGWIYTLCEDCRSDKEKYNPADISVPPFERLVDDSCPNVHTMLPPKEKNSKGKR